MKKIILTVLIGVLLISCKKDDNPSSDLPRTYLLDFTLLHTDGSLYENGDVEISGNTSIAELTDIVNGQYPWLEMGKRYPDAQGEASELFGVPCGAPNCESDYTSMEFAYGNEGGELEANEIWEKDKYWLIRYTNNDIDTLRIHDIKTMNPYNRQFSFFLNGIEIENGEDFSTAYGKIIIQK